MSSNIVVDNCIDLDYKTIESSKDIQCVSFKIIIDDKEITDEKLDSIKMIDIMKNCKSIKTACPSPQEFFNKLDKTKNNYIITVASSLSGSYNSAMIAKNMMYEVSPETVVHVFDCKSASTGETLVLLKLKELIDREVETNEIIKVMTDYTNNIRTYLLAQKLDNLHKSGRISSAKVFVGSLLHIHPILCDDRNEKLIIKEQVRGKKKSLKRLTQIISEDDNTFEGKTLGITHVNSRERAEKVKEELMSKHNFKDVVIFEANPVSTIFSDDQGIVVSF